jgi:hypothetical protein
MPIRRYLSESAVFEPEAIGSMSKAFDEACIALHVSSGDIHGRLAVATRIIDLASTGVVDANALRERLVAESQAVATVYLDRSKRSPRDLTTQSHPARAH